MDPLLTPDERELVHEQRALFDASRELPADLDMVPGALQALEAMRRLPQACLIVAGPVSDRTRRLADQRVTFLGQVSHDQIPTLMARATCAAFPATGGEALGLVLIEAMAAGIPVVASDIDGYRIASDDGRAALLSPPGDPDALAHSLSRLLTDGELRSTLLECGAAAVQRFDARVIAEQHLDLYRSLLRV